MDKTKKECKHKQALPLYARSQTKENNYLVNTKKICGETLYVCIRCGKLLRKKLSEVKE